MTAEKLHDAIGMLPADLIAEADKKRQGKPRVILWKRYAAMAACFALVLSCAWFTSMVLSPKGATEAAMEYERAEAPAAAAPMEPAAEAPACEEVIREEPRKNGTSGSGDPAEDAAAPETGEIRSDTTAEDPSLAVYSVETPLKPSNACFGSTPQVALIASRKDLDTYLTDKDWIYDFTAVREVCTAFDEVWFESHDLLLLTVHAAYPDVPYAVTSIESTGGTDPMGWDWYVFYTTAAENHPEGETTCFHLLTVLEKGQIAPEDSILPIADPIG